MSFGRFEKEGDADAITRLGKQGLHNQRNSAAEPLFFEYERVGVNAAQGKIAEDQILIR